MFVLHCRSILSAHHVCFAVGHSAVITEVNNHKKDITAMMKSQIARTVVQSYTQPSVEVVMVNVESGFELSNLQQEPSPWEDM